MEKKIYGYCSSQVFRKDISELCEHCPLTELINNVIKEQIVDEIKEKKDTLPEKQFKTYIEKEIDNASKSMSATKITELQNKDYKKDTLRPNRIRNYILNKERIKVLRKYLKNDNNDNSTEKTGFNSDFTNTELIELIAALYATKRIKGTSKEKFAHGVFKLFNKEKEFKSTVLNSTITQFKQRSEEKTTKFIDSLRDELKKNLSK